MEIVASPVMERSALRAFFGLFPYLRRHHWLMLLGLLVNFLNSASTVGAAAVGAYMVGRAALGADVSDLTPWLIALGVLVVARTVLGWLQMWVDHDIAYRLVAGFRIAIYDALERTAPAYLQRRRTGDVASAATSDAEKLEWFYAHTVATMAVAAVMPLVVLVLLYSVHPFMAAVAVPTALLLASVPWWLARVAHRQGSLLADRLGILSAEAVDSAQGLREVVGFGRGRDYAERLDSQGRELSALQLAYGRRAGLELAATDLITSAGVLVAIATAASLVAAGPLDAEMLPLAIVLAAFVYEPIVNLATILRGLGQVLAAAGRIFEVLDQPANVVDRIEAPGTQPASLDPRIEFRDVMFGYRSDRGDALRAVSLRVDTDETVALVGHSGAGKSTCLYLLLRFWDVDAGSITIGGVDIRDMSLSSLRQLISYVPQDVYLFNTTIRENIRLGRPEATDEEVVRAARGALIHDFILTLPEGYDTVVGERGAFLSGGQRQRVAIARALLKDAPILLMDEAVSNLDSESERQIQDAMSVARKGRTTLVIAHRLSTIRSADRVVVLRHGEVAEQGSHDDLLTQQGEYGRLVASQQHGSIEV